MYPARDLRQLQPALPRFALTRQLDAEFDRWFLWLPVMFSLGIAVYFALPGEPSLASALAPVAAAIAYRLVVRRGTLQLVLSAALLAAALGFAMAKLRTESMRAPVLLRSVGPAQMTGWVERIEPRLPRGMRLTLRVISIEELGENAWPSRVRIYSRFDGNPVAIGDAVQLRAVLKPLPEPVIPGGFDFARQAWFQRIGATGFLIARPELLADPPAMPLGLQLRTLSESLRRTVSVKVRAALPGPMGGVADALITGERGGIPEPVLEALRASGLAHILAISGLHMVMMAGAIYWLIRAGLALSPVLALSYPIRKWAAGLALVGAAGYLTLSGASIATQRAFIMLSLMFLAVLLDRPAISMRNLALAALAVLAFAPESLLDIGFQMSFAAVTGLVAVYEAIAMRQARRLGAGREPRARWRIFAYFGGILLTTAVASVSVAPLSAFHFHELARYSLAANLLAIPVFSLVVMPMALATLLAMPLGLEAWPLFVMGEGLAIVTAIADATSATPGSVARIASMPLAALQLMALGGLWLACWRGRWRLLGAAGIAAGVMLAPGLPRPDILIAGDASPIMVRDRFGQLQAMPARGGRFELTVWLEAEGDARDAGALPDDTTFWCDQSGCTALLHANGGAAGPTPAVFAEQASRWVGGLFGILQATAGRAWANTRGVFLGDDARDDAGSGRGDIGKPKGAAVQGTARKLPGVEAEAAARSVGAGSAAPPESGTIGRGTAGRDDRGTTERGRASSEQANGDRFAAAPAVGQIPLGSRASVAAGIGSDGQAAGPRAGPAGANSTGPVEAGGTLPLVATVTNAIAENEGRPAGSRGNQTGANNTGADKAGSISRTVARGANGINNKGRRTTGSRVNPTGANSNALDKAGGISRTVERGANAVGTKDRTAAPPAGSDAATAVTLRQNSVADLAIPARAAAETGAPSDAKPGQASQLSVRQAPMADPERPLLVAIARDASAVSEDCRRADIVILTFDQAQPCPSARLIIDRRDLKLKGAHAIRLTPAGFVIETVLAARGRRPWSSASLPQRRRRPNPAEAQNPAKAQSTAKPQKLVKP